MRQQRRRPLEPPLRRAPPAAACRQRAKMDRAKRPAQPPGAHRRVLHAHVYTPVPGCPPVRPAPRRIALRASAAAAPPPHRWKWCRCVVSHPRG
eukprot:4766422-Pleurochrysis_carterae.AAC.1